MDLTTEEVGLTNKKLINPKPRWNPKNCCLENRFGCSASQLALGGVCKSFAGGTAVVWEKHPHTSWRPLTCFDLQKTVISSKNMAATVTIQQHLPWFHSTPHLMPSLRCRWILSGVDAGYATRPFQRPNPDDFELVDLSKRHETNETKCSLGQNEGCFEISLIVLNGQRWDWQNQSNP